MKITIGNNTNIGNIEWEIPDDLANFFKTKKQKIAVEEKEKLIDFSERIATEIELFFEVLMLVLRSGKVENIKSLETMLVQMRTYLRSFIKPN